MKRLSSIILLAASLFIISAEAFKPSMDGRAVVADYGELPVGFFAKSASFLPGDTVIVTNPSTKISVEVMIFGSFDSSEGIAIILSPEAARELYITKGSNSIVQVTKKNSVYTESTILSRNVNKNGITEDPDIDPSLLIEDPVFDTPAITEELPVFDPPEPSVHVASNETEKEPEISNVELVYESEPGAGDIAESGASEENVPEYTAEMIEPEHVEITNPLIEPKPYAEIAKNDSKDDGEKETKLNEERESILQIISPEPEPVKEPVVQIVEPEPEPASEVNELQPVFEPQPVNGSETIKEPEPVVEPKPVSGPEPVNPTVTDDNVGASNENKTVYPTGKTGIINREPRNTSDSVNPRDSRKTETPTEPVPENLPQPDETETDIDFSNYDSNLFMAENPIEFIDNEFVAVVKTAPEPVSEPTVVVNEPESATKIAEAEPESVSVEDTTENKAILVPTKPNPPGPAVSEIGSTSPSVRPEKQTAMVTSDSIYEGEDRVMQKYNYSGNELSSEIYEANPEDEKIADVTETNDAIETDDTGFVDEPQVFIIPIIDVTETENETDYEIAEIEPEASESIVQKKEEESEIVPKIVEPEPAPVQVIKPVITQTDVTPSQTTVINPVQISDIKTVKATDLDKGCYIQIATYSKMSNVKDLCEKYSARYPVKVVEMSSGNGWQVLVGDLSESEYTVVLERFKAYGYKDAFLKRVK